MDLKKVLITGADGMVGSYLDFGIKTNRAALNVTNLEEALRAADKFRPQAIVHLAAETDVDKCEREPEHAFFVNAGGTYNMALAARRAGAKFVYISTAGIFDGEKDGPYAEDDRADPKNYYGHSKYAGELIVRSLLDDYIIARACWMFGGGPEKDKKFVYKIIQQLGNPEIKAINDAFGSPTFGKDLVAAIKELLIRDARGIFHLSNKGVASRFDVARKITEVLRPEARVSPVDSNYFVLDAKRVKNESLVSRSDLMRPWQDALEEYLRTEWIQFSE